MKFRKKPVVIEAVLFDGTNRAEVESLHPPACQWEYDANDNALLIPTLEGTMAAKAGDWIIQGVQGEMYPCKADIFEATYEPVEDK